MLNSTPFYPNSADSPNSPSHEVKTLWQNTLAELARTMTRATYTSLLMGSKAIALSDGLLTVAAPSAHSVDWLNHRLQSTIARSLSNIAGEPLNVSFVYMNEQTQQRPSPTPSQFSSARTIKSHSYALAHEHVRSDELVHKRYFSTHWRPLLGPLLSELIRELRELAHELGQVDGEHALVDVLQSDLAHALGVSRSTIARAITRLPNGNFEHEYLGYFLREVSVVQYRDANGRIRNDKTRFVIRLNDPPVPSK